ncbi:beta-N-acetylglucosaminidase domain-containing protein [Mycoplasma sp. CSL7491-lung]|uniref:beta-N-acetylglucosaminidase domain-containing protein n=1 Tax=Mycoplasma sp. CSL7491-lung TaxID=549718 RepID=UPI001C0FCE44|nr:beta-N-acetylglucosaminidase domain-containing protein [Mycoplasma sp. CSL7491-lung]MBU4692914.1 beta-N-acetylglucosaminidase domain-containing protein [Mycoplasma sp. CSL7491-lung]
MNIKKIVKYVLSAAGSAGLIASISAVETGETENTTSPTQVANRKTYEIYPKVQKIDYLDGNYLLTQNVNIVFENGIDEATVDRFKEVLDIKNLQYTITKHIVKGQTNILVGIKGDADNLVDNLIKSQNTEVNEELYEKTDSYQINNNNNVLSVLAKDTDAAFYGATTLWHIFNQLNGREIENFKIEDYADVTTRGVIEGYYGNPWSLEDRLDYMKWGTYYKLNGYFYAPKNDPKHSTKWRELYTDEEIENLIKPLAETGNKTKVRYIYTLHPFFGQRMNESNYEQSLVQLKAKFLQVIKAGVRQIGILADDAGTPFPGNNNQKMQKRLLDDVVEWLKMLQPEYPGLKTTLPYVVQEYGGYGQDYFRTFPKEVQIVMTGGRIWGEISQDFTNRFTQNVGRGPMLWINWPCSDNSKSHLILGGYKEFLHRNVDASKIEGVIFNPMQQSQPSRVAIFGGADYTWNIWQTDDEAEKSYEASFKYVLANKQHDDEESNAFRELSKHMINQNMDGRVVALQESVDIKDKLNEFKSKLNNDSYTDEELNEIQTIFNDLNKYSNIMLNGKSNEKMKEQIIYWLKSFEELSKGVSLYIDALKDYKAKDTFNFIDHYNQALNKISESKTHKFWYLDHFEIAEVGVQHIQPFIRSLQAALSKKYSELLIPDKLTFEFETNRTVQVDSPAGDIFDYSNQKQQIWKVAHDGTDSKFVQGDYFGANASTPFTLKTLFIKMGDRNDHFKNFKVQYKTKDGQWTDLNGQTNITRNDVNGPFEPVYIENINIENVVGVRVVNNQSENFGAWLRVTNLVINQPKETNLENGWYTDLKYDGQHGGNREVRTTNQNTNPNVLFDNNQATEFWTKNYQGAPSNDAISVDATLTFTLPEPRTITKVLLQQGNSAGGDILTNFDIQYEVENGQWQKFGEKSGNSDKSQTFTGNVKAKRIRVKNNTNRNVWWRIGTFKVGNDSAALDNKYLLKNGNTEGFGTTKSSTGFQLLHESEPSQSHELTLEAGKEIGIDVQDILEFSSVTGEYDKIPGVELQYSKDGYTWTKIDDLSTLKGSLGFRFIRFKNTSETESKTFNFKLLNLVLQGEKVFGKLIKSDIAINQGWGDQRHSHKEFDRNVNTTTKFGGNPAKGNVAVYDLGKEIDLRSLKLYATDGTADYPRDLDVLYSTTNSDNSDSWKLAFTIGDDVTDADRESNLSKINSGENDSNYPNVRWWGNTNIENAKARYIKLLVKANYPTRALLFNEIVVNDFEYISLNSNPKFTGTNYVETDAAHVTDKTIDGNLSSYYTPANKNGNLTYIVNKGRYDAADVRIITQGDNSGSTVKVRVYNTSTKQYSEKELGKLTNNIVEFKIPLLVDEKVVSFDISWQDKTPSIVEIIPISKKQTEETNKEQLQNLVNAKPENYQTWIKVDKDSYDLLEVIAKETLKSQQIRQSTIDSIKNSLEKISSSARTKFDSDRLDQIMTNLLSNEDELYTTESFNAYQFVVNQIVEALKDKDNLTEEIVNSLEAEYNDKKSKLVTLPYKKQSVTLDISKFDSLKSDNYTSETYNVLKEKVDQMKQKLSDSNTNVEEFNNLDKEFNDLFSKLVASEKGQLTRKYEIHKDQRGYKFIDKYYLRFPELTQQMQELIDETEQEVNKDDATKESIQLLIDKIDTKYSELRSKIIEIDPNNADTTEDIIDDIDESLVPDISHGNDTREPETNNENNETANSSDTSTNQPNVEKPNTKEIKNKNTPKSSSGAIVGGILGSLGALILAGIAVIFFKKKNKK